MSTMLLVSVLGALALTSGIALAAAQPEPSGEALSGDLTRAQAVGMAGKHFAWMDANRDGTVDAADRDAAHARMAERMFERVDADKDGSISRDEWNAGAARLAEANGPRHALKMRRPAGDEALTREDFERRALERFDRADADKNGVISAAEREQAHAAMRGRSGRH